MQSSSTSGEVHMLDSPADVLRLDLQKDSTYQAAQQYTWVLPCEKSLSGTLTDSSMHTAGLQKSLYACALWRPLATKTLHHDHAIASL